MPTSDVQLCQIRLRAEYLEHGVGIFRLTPVYEPLPTFPFLAETVQGNLGGVRPASTISVISVTQVLDNRKSMIHPPVDTDEGTSGEDDEMWTKLPRWMKALDDLKRKARSEKSA